MDIPSLARQNKIASILSAYDVLIENNQKRIKLLEETTQQLYKEWFVRLRFPGYETMPIVDGVPKGWKYSALTDLLEIKYGKEHKGLNDGEIPVYGAGGIMRKADKMLYSGESVLIPRKGSLNNILYVSGDFWTIDTMFYTTPKKNNIVKYAYCFLRLLDMFSFDVGAAVPSMTVKILSSIKLLVPTDTVLHSFERIMQPMFQQMDTLAEQNKNLIKQRDLLLPRLMSGKLAV